MRSTPQVSVIIPAYNSAEFIAAAIQSVLSQQHVALELIIIDDGSKDESAAIARSFADQRIVLLQNLSPGGPARARNQGITAARAPYVAFLDADDVMSADSMRSAVLALDASPTAVMAFGDLSRIDAQGRVVVESVHAAYPVFQKLPRAVTSEPWSLIRSEDFARGLLYENFIGTGAVVVRASALGSTGLFDETLFNSEDRDLWFRLARLGDALYTSRVVLSYRVNLASISHAKGERNARNRLKVLHRERQHWADGAAIRQLDRLIAENHASIGYARRAQGRRLSAATSFASAYLTSPSWPFLRGLVGSLIGNNRR